MDGGYDPLAGFDPAASLPVPDSPELLTPAEIAERAAAEAPSPPSRTARGAWQRTVRRLLARYGPCTLAYLETIVRVADWRASGGKDLPEESAYQHRRR